MPPLLIINFCVFFWSLSSVLLVSLFIHALYSFNSWGFILCLIRLAHLLLLFFFPIFLASLNYFSIWILEPTGLFKINGVFIEMILSLLMTLERISLWCWTFLSKKHVFQVCSSPLLYPLLSSSLPMHLALFC